MRVAERVFRAALLREHAPEAFAAPLRAMSAMLRWRRLRPRGMMHVLIRGV